MVIAFASFAALFHYLAFVIESFLWTKPKVRKRFLMTEEEAKASSLMAFNQGFYNLFLAIGTTVGILFIVKSEVGTNVKLIGNTLIAFNMSCMIGAALVLIFSEPKLFRGAIMQGVPPLLALCSLLI